MEFARKHGNHTSISAPEMIRLRRSSGLFWVPRCEGAECGRSHGRAQSQRLVSLWWRGWTRFLVCRTNGVRGVTIRNRRQE